MDIERRSNRSHTVDNSFWNRLWPPRKTDCRMHEWIKEYDLNTRLVSKVLLRTAQVNIFPHADLQPPTVQNNRAGLCPSVRETTDWSSSMYGMNEGYPELGNHPMQQHHTPCSQRQRRTQEFFLGGGGVQQIQLRTEERENGDLGAVAP